MYNRNNNGLNNKSSNDNKRKQYQNSIKIDNTECYINPYNFITLPKTCERKSYEDWQEDRQEDLNGVIECVLKAETPIMIPDTENVKIIDLCEGKEHKEYQFFNYNEKNENFIIPVIPGSEIRGMLRSDYETFTDSCMSTLSEDINLISRTTEIKLPGILEKDSNGKWTLYEATRYSLHTCRKNEGSPRKAQGFKEAIYLVDEKNEITIEGKKVKTGDKVNFRAKNSGLSVLEIGNGDKIKTGIVFIGETGGKKEKDRIHDSIFVKSEKIVEVEKLNEEVEKLEAIFDMYNDEAFNQKIKEKNKTWYAGYDIKNGKTLPVWYSKPVNKRTYLSLASIGKEAYYRTISELVGDFMPCVDRKKICNCCNLFGFVSDEDAESSKIRISDAIYSSNENPYDKKMTIKELASPHIANATFYALYAPETGFVNMPQTFDFNYDFKTDKEGKHLIPSKDISIRGRKQYWHHSDIGNAIETNISKSTNRIETDRNCTITPVKSGAEFSFKIYFNDIKEENLKELISVINLEYGTKNLSHKIGKGKPLGFGSCKIKVKNVYLRHVYMDNGKLKYEMKEYKTDNISLENFKNMESIPMKEALRIYDFDYIKKNYPEAKVQYPIGSKKNKNGENSMFWFMLNKSTNMKNAYVIMVLPRIIDGKDENGNEGFQKTDIKVNENVIGKTHGLLLPKYKQ